MRLAIGGGCLIFHLKHDVLYLELLSQLFGTIDLLEWIAWVVDELTAGEDARRAGFFMNSLWMKNWISMQKLPGHIDVMDDQERVAASLPKGL